MKNILIICTSFIDKEPNDQNLNDHTNLFLDLTIFNYFNSGTQSKRKQNRNRIY